MTIRPCFIAALIALGGCAGEANHLGNPLLLPGAAIASGIDNARYDARRGKVKRYVSTNRSGIHRDIKSGGGARLDQAMNLAGVAQNKRVKLRQELRATPALYRQADIEPLVVALMVYAN